MCTSDNSSFCKIFNFSIGKFREPLNMFRYALCTEVHTSLEIDAPNNQIYFIEIQIKNKYIFIIHFLFLFKLAANTICAYVQYWLCNEY